MGYAARLDTKRAIAMLDAVDMLAGHQLATE
jgi:hypothetical protein